MLLRATPGSRARIASACSSVPVPCPAERGTHAASMNAATGSADDGIRRSLSRKFETVLRRFALRQHGPRPPPDYDSPAERRDKRVADGRDGSARERQFPVGVQPFDELEAVYALTGDVQAQVRPATPADESGFAHTTNSAPLSATTRAPGRSPRSGGYNRRSPH